MSKRSPLRTHRTTVIDSIDSVFKKSGRTSLKCSTTKMFVYKWQKRALSMCNELLYGNKECMIINVPTAGGKSGFIKCISLLAKDENYKVIILTPQIDISAEFENHYITESGQWYYDRGMCHPIGKDGIWGVDYTFMNKSNKGQQVYDLLCRRNPVIITCCYPTFNGAMRIANEQGIKIFNTIVIIDEAHHINCSRHNENELGHSINYIRSGVNNKFIGCSATYFRNDSVHLFPKDMQSGAITYTMDIHDMLSDREICPDLRHIHQDIRMHLPSRGDACGYNSCIREIFENDCSLKTGIWIQESDTNGEKVIRVRGILDNIGKVIKDRSVLKYYGVEDDEYREANGNVIYVLTGSGRLLRVVDLANDDDTGVYERCRRDRERYFELHKEGEKSIDVVIALKKLREGSNWKPLQRVILLGYRQLLSMIQIIGRGYRHYDGKRDLYIHHIFKYGRFQGNDIHTESWMNDYINACWSMLFLIEAYYPIEKRFSKSSMTKGDKRVLTGSINTFNKVFLGQIDEGNKFIQSVHNRMEMVYVDDGSVSVSELRRGMHEIIKDELIQRGHDTVSDKEVLNIVRYVWVRLCVNHPKNRSKTKLNYKLVWEKGNPLGIKRYMITRILNIKSASEYREYLRSLANVCDTESFIIKSQEVHGNLYDYSKVKYVNSTTKVIIICKDHGEFEQSPRSHLSGKGCPKCSGQNKTTEEFIKQARGVHGKRYDYSKVTYVNAKTKVIIKCKEHGEFEQSPNSHLSGKGCPKCSGQNKTTEDFIKQAREVHGNRYDYSKVKYVNWEKKVIIICKEHGEFEQSPNSHLSGKGCPKCARPNSF